MFMHYSHYVCWGTRKIHDQNDLLYHPEGLPQLPVMSQWHGIAFKILPGIVSELFPKLQDNGMETLAMGARVGQVDFNVTSGYSPRVLAGSLPRYVALQLGQVCISM